MGLWTFTLCENAWNVRGQQQCFATGNLWGQGMCQSQGQGFGAGTGTLCDNKSVAIFAQSFDRKEGACHVQGQGVCKHTQRRGCVHVPEVATSGGRGSQHCLVSDTFWAFEHAILNKLFVVDFVFGNTKKQDTVLDQVDS